MHGLEEFTLVIRRPGGKPQSWHAQCFVRGMDYMPYLGDAREVTDAAELIALFGEDAGYEAAARADRSRDLGNHIHFCRWRQIERLIVLMSIEHAVGTVH